MPLTSTQQRNAVSEGMALGLLMCDADALPFTKLAIDLAFNAAWLEWPQRSLFPQVSSDLRNGSDPTRVITRASERSHTFNLFWDLEGWVPTVFSRSASETELDVEFVASVISGQLPAERWRHLAAAFLEHVRR